MINSEVRMFELSPDSIVEGMIGGLAGGMAVEVVFLLARTRRRRRGINRLRGFLKEFETSVKGTGGSDGHMPVKPVTKLAGFRSRLQNAKMLAISHEHLTAEQDIGLMLMLEETLDMIEGFPRNNRTESEIYGQFFDGLGKLRWLKF